jgi:septum formation protein
VCLGCDTIVVLDGSILGKPVDAAEAARMLGRLSGRTHTVISALALACGDLDHAEVSSQTTRVRFRTLEPREIRRYAATSEPLDKAGAYGIQGWGALMVEAIDGCYFTVMGLPLQSLRELWLSLFRRIQQPLPEGGP